MARVDRARQIGGRRADDSLLCLLSEESCNVSPRTVCQKSQPASLLVRQAQIVRSVGLNCVGRRICYCSLRHLSFVDFLSKIRVEDVVYRPARVWRTYLRVVANLYCRGGYRRNKERVNGHNSS
jgi:hypothetical protein